MIKQEAPELNIHDYMRIIKRRRYVVIFAMLLGAFVAYLFSLSILYRSRVGIAFNNNKTISRIVADVAFNTTSNLNTIEQTITRTSVLEKTAIKLGMIKKDDPVTKKDAAIRRLSKKVSTEIDEDSEIIYIIVTSRDARECANIANTIAETFAEDAVRRNTEELTNARKFISKELENTRNKLKEVEAKIQKSREKYSIVDIGIELENKLITIRELEKELSKVRAERELKLQELNTYTKKNKNSESFKKIISSKTYEVIKGEILKEQMNLFALMGKFKGTHPDIVASKRKIKNLRENLTKLLMEDFNIEMVKYAVDIESLKAKELAYERLIKKQKKSYEKFPQIKSQLEQLDEEAEIYRGMIKSFGKKLEEVGVLEAEKTGQAPDILNRASVPIKPVSKNKFLLVAVGVISGFIAGIFLVFYIETIDITVSTVEDVEEFIKVPVLGLLPYVTARTENTYDIKSKLSRKCVSYHEPKSVLSESLRMVRTNIRTKYKDEKLFLITSNNSGEGKSFVASNLAIIYAQLGSKVLLIDLNLRDPDIHRYFNLSRIPGISDVLVAGIDYKEIIKKTEIPGLDVMTTGPVPPNPCELLEKDRFKKMIDELKNEYDVIICDSPPLMLVADTSIICSTIKNTIFVHNSIKTGLSILNRGKHTIEDMNGRVSGVVLNQLKTTVGYYYGNYGNYKYVSRS
jgi:capsular exopolysaccharide synthesis family protein